MSIFFLVMGTGYAQAGRQYRVQPGDTLFHVSRIYNINWRLLVDANQLQPPYNITAGQILVVPSGDEAPYIDPSRGNSAASLADSPSDVDTSDTSLSDDHGSLPPSTGELTHIPIPPKTVASQTNSHRIPVPVLKPAFKAVTELASVVHSPSSLHRFIWPVQGKLLSTFGTDQTGKKNDGINIKASENSEIVSAANGVVIYVGTQIRGLGNVLMIRHKDDFITTYAHINQIYVNEGDNVVQGQTIAHVGSTGSVTEPQLHFAIRKGTSALDPTAYLPQ